MKLLCKVLCIVLTVLIFESTICLAGNLGYDDLKGVNKGRFIYDMGTGRLAAQPWEYRLAFLIAGYDYRNIPDMVFYIKTGKWVQLKKDKKEAKVMDFDEKRGFRIKNVSLKKGDWVLKNGANVLLTENGNIIQRQVWEWWRTDTFREIVALVGEVAIVAAAGSILAKTIGRSETHNIFSSSAASGGGSGGPAPPPSN